MKQLLLVVAVVFLIISSCKTKIVTNCNYQLPKDYCLYYNSNTKEYIVGFEKHDTVIARYIQPGVYINITAGDPNVHAGIDTTMIYSFSQYWVLNPSMKHPQWWDDKKYAVRFSDSCIAKGTVEQFFKEKAIKDSTWNARAKAAELEAFKYNHQDSLNNAFQPINCR